MPRDRDPDIEARDRIFEAIRGIGTRAFESDVGRGVRSFAARIDPFGFIEDPAKESEEIAPGPFGIPDPAGLVTDLAFGPSRLGGRVAGRGAALLRPGLDDILKRREELSRVLPRLQRGPLNALRQRGRRVREAELSASRRPFEFSDRIMGEIDQIKSSLQRRVRSTVPERRGKSFTPNEKKLFNDRAADEVVDALNNVASTINRGGVRPSKSALQKIIAELVGDLPQGVSHNQVLRRLDKMNILDDAFGVTSGEVKRTLGGRKRR